MNQLTLSLEDSLKRMKLDTEMPVELTPQYNEILVEITNRFNNDKHTDVYYYQNKNHPYHYSYTSHNFEYTFPTIQNAMTILNALSYNLRKSGFTLKVNEYNKNGEVVTVKFNVNNDYIVLKESVF